MVKMGISETILEELKRYNKINNYITEQEAGLPPVPGEDPLAAPAAPDAGALPPAPEAGVTPPPADAQPIDVANDPDVEKVGDEGESSETEELEITDLVKSQQNIETKQEEYFNNLFSQLSNLESKLRLFFDNVQVQPSTKPSNTPEVIIPVGMLVMATSVSIETPRNELRTASLMFGLDRFNETESKDTLGKPLRATVLAACS